MESFTCETCDGNVCLQKLKTSPFSSYEYLDQTKIINKGRCIPELDLSRTVGKVTRKFNSYMYVKYKWLSGCIHSNRLFCFPCLLFSNNSNVWNSTGYKDLNNYTKAIYLHDQSENHIVSSLKLYTFGKNNSNLDTSSQDKLDIERHNARVDRNRIIFRRIIDVICFMVKQELAFRGCDDSTSSNKCDFLELIDLLARYDSILDTHMQTPSNLFTGLTSRTQDDIISSVASILMDEIKKQVETTDFVAVLVDETADVCGREQLVLILRYFHNSVIQDRFVKYADVSEDGTAIALSSVLEVLDKFNCWSKLVTQTYDGAVVLSSELNVLKAIVREKCPLALNVWCSAHGLNLILTKYFERVTETKCFLSIIKSLSNFFLNDTKHSSYYDNFSKRNQLPRVAETRWAYHSGTVNTIFTEQTSLIEFFEDMQNCDDDWDGDTLVQVSAYLDNLKEFDFNFFLHTFSQIFSETNYLDEILQIKITDTVYCVQIIQQFKTFIHEYRSKFDTIYDNAAMSCGQPKRRRNIDDIKSHYERVFMRILDNILSEITARYSNIKKLTFFELLSCNYFLNFRADFPMYLVKELDETYVDKFNVDRLVNELKCVFKSSQFSDLSVYEIVSHLYENKLQSIFPEVLLLAKLIITIPASSASDERSFSALKRIHTSLKSTQGHQRLTDLSLISIEKQLLIDLKRDSSFYNNVIDSYIKKDSNVDLIYK